MVFDTIKMAKYKKIIVRLSQLQEMQLDKVDNMGNSIWKRLHHRLHQQHGEGWEGGRGGGHI